MHHMCLLSLSLIVYEGKFPLTFLIGSSLRFGENGKFEPLHLIFELGFNDLTSNTFF